MRESLCKRICIEYRICFLSSGQLLPPISLRCSDAKDPSTGFPMQQQPEAFARIQPAAQLFTYSGGKIALSDNVSYFSLHKCPVRRSQLSQRLQDQESTPHGMTADTPPKTGQSKHH